MRATGLLAWAVANDSRISDANDRLGAFRRRGGWPLRQERGATRC